MATPRATNFDEETQDAMSPLARFEKLDDEKKSNILETAAAEFAANGFEGASLNQIINNATISKGTFYYYFEDKFDLFGAVFRHYFDPRMLLDRELIMSAETPDDFWEYFTTSSHQSMMLAVKKPLAIELGTALSALSPELLAQGEVGAYIAEVTALLVEVIEHGQDIGAIRTDIPLEFLIQIWTSVDMAFTRWSLPRWKDLDEEEQADLMLLGIDTYKRIMTP